MEYKILRDPYYEQFFREKLFKPERFRKGWHIHRGDLIYCLRKAYFRLVGIPAPEVPVIEFSIIGKTLHRIIEDSFRYVEQEVEKDGISATVDIVASFVGGSLPIEVKTTRKRILDAGDIPVSYIEQLAIAMVMMNSDKGLLAILNIVTTELQVWLLQMTLKQRQTFWREILRRKTLLEKAIKLNNPLLLPRTLWMCSRCEYRTLCDKLEREAHLKASTTKVS